MKKFLKVVLSILIICIGIYIVGEIYQEYKIKDVSISKINKTNKKIGITKEKNIQEKLKIDLKLVEKEYKGYKVDAKLQIKKLDIDTYVLKV